MTKSQRSCHRSVFQVLQFVQPDTSDTPVANEYRRGAVLAHRKVCCPDSTAELTLWHRVHSVLSGWRTCPPRTQCSWHRRKCSLVHAAVDETRADVSRHLCPCPDRATVLPIAPLYIFLDRTLARRLTYDASICGTHRARKYVEILAGAALHFRHVTRVRRVLCGTSNSLVPARWLGNRPPTVGWYFPRSHAWQPSCCPTRTCPEHRANSTAWLPRLGTARHCSLGSLSAFPNSGNARRCSWSNTIQADHSSVFSLMDRIHILYHRC